MSTLNCSFSKFFINIYNKFSLSLFFFSQLTPLSN
nr:MAG TPA: hypothetical protein [Caudoviricetes sp.]